MKKWILGTVFAMLAAMSQSSWAQGGFFDESFGNYREELEVAREAGKQGVFMFFQMDECPFCRRMETTIMTEPDVIALFKAHFLNFEVDIEGSNEVTDFDGTVSTAQQMSEKKYRVRATPVMMIFDLDGNPVLKYTGPTRTKEEFKLLAQYVIDGAYKTMPFTKYKRQQK
ncbi:MAG: thioredoxin fold domain-containing protein [Gammaproteobacteria bacterium]|jgi:thioredoxin-related protein|nr:thioredoxin fold domain-containing protein [Gammaproteobacteria bacterium]MBD3776428.1 thioredoxin fold domain-containing protein [Thiotrichales bacterium]